MGRKPKQLTQVGAQEVVSNPGSRDTIEHLTPDPGAEKGQRDTALENLRTEFSGGPGPGPEAPAPVNKGGRPKKNKQLEEEKERAYMEALKSDFSAFSGVLLDVVCVRMPNPMPATPGEKALFGNAVSRMIEKYAPMMNGYDAELAFGLAALVVFAPRIQKQKKETPPATAVTVPENGEGTPAQGKVTIEGA